MKITHVKLTNFSRIYSGIGKTVLEIDLTGVTNNIHILVGPNGSGKSSIMKCLHPFAYNKAIQDNTASQDLIIDGMDGEKELTIRDGSDIYKIHHFYKRDKNGKLTVQSYISLNEEELNVSGTSTSFKSMVKEYLGIDEDFLTLLSVGNNINGFVELSASDRKNFSMKIFSELDVYGRLYKSVSETARHLNSQLSAVSSKFDQFQDVDKRELEENITEAERSLRVSKETKADIDKEIGGILARLDMYRSDIEQYNAYQAEISDLLSKIDSIRTKLKSDSSYEELVEQKAEYAGKITNLELEIEKLNGKITANLDKVNDLSNTRNTYSQLISSFTSGKDYNGMVAAVERLNDELKELEIPECCKEFNLNGISLADTYKADSILEKLSNIVGQVVFNCSNNDRLLDIFEKFTDMDNKEAYYKQLETTVRKLKDSVEFGELINRFPEVLNRKIVTECEQEGSCPYKTFYEEYVSTIRRKTAEESSGRVALLNSTKEEYHVVGDLRNAAQYIRDNIDILNKIPTVIFDEDNYLQLFAMKRVVYDRDRMMDFVQARENIDRIASIKDKIADLETQIKDYNTNSKRIESLKTNCTQAEQKINALEEEYDDLMASKEGLRSALTECKTFLEDVIEPELKLKEELNTLRASMDDASAKLRDMSDKHAEISSLNIKLDERREKEAELNKTISAIEVYIRQTTTKLENLVALEKEEMDLRANYDNVMEVRKAVSPITGIPVDFIKYFVKTKMINEMNYLLDKVYNGRLRLMGDLVTIDDKEFTIPYKKNNTIVKDISKASDGERAMITLAFSLVLIQVYLDKYNIMLLDELDTTLDQYCRVKFIELLEAFRDRIGSEQVFLITHNNMFDSYPVHIMMTGETSTRYGSHVEKTELY